MEQIATIREQKAALRLEICSWQRAAAGLLALSVAANAALYGVLGLQEARHRQEADELRTELHLAEQVRDQAVRELGALALDTARERQAREEQAAAYEAVGAWEYIGECEITAYCCEPYGHICGTGDGLTASGLPVGPGIVAVDPEVIPLGSTVIIDGQRYLAADTGGLVQGLHVDIALPTHAEAEDFGVQSAPVWIALEEGAEADG